MKITDTQINKRVIEAHINGEELKSLLVGVVASETGVNTNHIDRVEIDISKTEDFTRENQAHITLTINTNGPKKGDENGK